MTSHVVPREAYDPSQMPLDFSNIDDMFDGDGNFSQNTYNLDPLCLQPQELQSMMVSSDTSFDPLFAKSLSSTTDPLLPQHIGLDSNASSHMSSPLDGSLQSHLAQSQAWFHDDASKTNHLHFLDTSFNLMPADFNDFDPMIQDMSNFSVDPSLIQHPHTPATSAGLTPFSNVPHLTSQMSSQMSSLSPTVANDSPHSWVEPGHSHQSPPLTQPTREAPSRKHSVQTSVSLSSQGTPPGGFSVTDEDGKERVQCPYPDCGKSFKDLKAHMLTHQNERPEKCPISSCEFHRRGFARKYDRNRHLVTTHYKATITCGFCPGEDSTAAKTFNRTDVFKRHLVTSHGVDQNTSASKKRTSRGAAKQSPIKTDGSSGKCSTCGDFFPSPQELFDHLDECILRVVTQKDPSESTNEENLRSIETDENVIATMQRHALPSAYPASVAASVAGDRDSCSDDDETSSRKMRKMNTGSSLAIVPDALISRMSQENSQQRGLAGLTFSKGGRDLAVAKGRRKRKDYPQSWGCSMDDMTLKKRVLCVFDGTRRLWKDDMMLGNQFEVRMQLPDGGFVTDLDVETLKRAEAFHNATDEERGPWLPTNFYAQQLPTA